MSQNKAITAKIAINKNNPAPMNIPAMNGMCETMS
jgi:hypothetical protein